MNKNDSQLTKENKTTFEITALVSEGPEIWNWISEHVKAEATAIKLQKLINNLFGRKCFCSLW